MVSAIVLILCDKGTINTTAEALSQIPGITEVHTVSGRVDLVAVIRVSNNEHLAEIITDKMLNVPGVSHTETLISFRAFSRYNLESLFSSTVR